MITEHYYTKVNNKMKSHYKSVKSMSKPKERSISKDALVGSIIGIGGLTLIAIIGILIHH